MNSGEAAMCLMLCGIVRDCPLFSFWSNACHLGISEAKLSVMWYEVIQGIPPWSLKDSSRCSIVYFHATRVNKTALIVFTMEIFRFVVSVSCMWPTYLEIFHAPSNLLQAKKCTQGFSSADKEGDQVLLRVARWNCSRTLSASCTCRLMWTPNTCHESHHSLLAASQGSWTQTSL